MKLIKQYIGLGVIVAGLASCVSEGNETGIEYAPQMYVAVGPEAFTQVGEWDYNQNGMSMRLPVNGTVAHGKLDYVYNLTEGQYEESAALVNPVSPTKENVLVDGKHYYDTYCWNCHGKAGGNDGPVMSEDRFPPPPWPSYQADYIKTLPVGKMYHTITYGKGLMGSHAYALSPEERWKLIHYVKYLSFGEDSFEFAEVDLHMENTGMITTRNAGDELLDGLQGFELVSLTTAEQSMIQSVFEHINFGLMSAKIKEDSYEHLDQLATFLEGNEVRAFIAGFAVNVGADNIQENLAEKRAEAVKTYLVDKGIESSRLITKGFGEVEDQDNETTEDRQANRKVEVKIIR